MLYNTTCRWAANTITNKKPNPIQIFICEVGEIGESNSRFILLFTWGKG